jgi:hypothetical protein
MRVGLIHVGGALPNLALMRLSTYHKARGDSVFLHPTPMDCPDLVYISTLFTWQQHRVKALAASFPNSDLQIGGSGWDLTLRLPREVDALRSDYDLYGIDYGMGYSSRGCIRTCAFCPVPKAEGAIREDTPIVELLNPKSKKLALLDNNFFASDWRPKIAEIRARGLIVDWPQGNDLRLLTPEIARALGELRQRGQLAGHHFRRRGVLHFAWDLPANDARRTEVIAGVRLLFAVGFRPRDLRFCLLVGFPGYDAGEEVERIRTLHELGIEPYVMVYRDYGDEDNRDRLRMDIQHWNNGHAWRRVPFNDYRRERCN